MFCKLQRPLTDSRPCCTWRGRIHDAAVTSSRADPSKKYPPRSPSDHRSIDVANCRVMRHARDAIGVRVDVQTTRRVLLRRTRPTSAHGVAGFNDAAVTSPVNRVVDPEFQTNPVPDFAGVVTLSAPVPLVFKGTFAASAARRGMREVRLIADRLVHVTEPPKPSHHGSRRQLAIAIKSSSTSDTQAGALLHGTW